ncbi:MAG TPA: nucleotide exchange factor GrpE [Candidatus Binataceae bacterium]|nr:nucleotide exchange factor GrpE [Candidatus Binataceae bacterium]
MSKHHKNADGNHPQHNPAHPGHDRELNQEPRAEHADAANSDDPAGSDGGEPGDPQAALAAKEQELAELKDKYLRALADGENARKRIRQQSEESVRIQREAILRELLPIIDNLERAVSAARLPGSEAKTIIDGVEMVLRSMMDLLRGQGVTPLESVGQAFDPARHEAVDQVSSAVHAPNTVVEEFHRGYQIGDRVLRTARVSVSKGARGQSNGENDASDVENN